MAKKKNPVVKILVILIGILVILFLGRNVIAKVLVQSAVGTVTGFPLKIGSLNIGAAGNTLHIQNMKLFNPARYPDRVMVDIPEIFAQVDTSKLLGGNVHINEIRFDMKEFLVVRNAEGQLNLDELKAIQDQMPKKEKAEVPAKTEKESAPMELRVEKMSLKVGKVIFKDYSKGGEPSVKEFPINLNEQYENIPNLQAVISLIVVKTLAKTTIASLTNFDLNSLQGSLANTLGSAGALATKTIGATTEKTKEALEATTGTITDTIGDTGNKLKGLLKKPFGD